MAVTAGVVGGLAAAVSQFDGPQTGAFIALLAYVPAALLVWHWRGPVAGARRRPAADVGGDGIAGEGGEHSADVAGGTPTPTEPPADLAISAAWEKAAQLAPQAGDQLSAARMSCARLLHLQGRGVTQSPAALETTVLIRNHVEPLVEDTARACESL